ncbi:TPA: C40 family peptidase [Enterococcus faecium]
MKKKLLTLFLVMSFSIVLSVYYNTIVFSEQINYTEEQYNIEKEKALKVGYSEEQFKQIMEIPTNLSNENSETRIVNYTMTSNQTKVINKAMEQIGKPYEWGASGPNSFDCGGLVKYVYKQAVNIELPMGTTNQEQYGTEVSLNSLKPGDLLFYGNRGATYHVGIYKGNGVMIHAPQPVDLSQYLGHILVETVKPFFLLLILQIPVGLDSESSYGFDFGYKILQCS